MYLPIQGQGDGIQDGRLASPRISGDGKQAALPQQTSAEVNLLPDAQGVEVVDADLEYFHGANISFLRQLFS